jgi:putative membrane protein
MLFAVVMYLILVESLSPWVNLPGLGNIGFTLFFVLFSLAHCWALEGPKRTAIFFAVSAVVTYALEETGVRTGLVFGAYHYSEFMMIYPSRMVAKAVLRGVDMRTIPGMTALATLSAMVMTAWDLVMDPGMSTLGQNWVWENGGVYFGVPRHNYLGWLLTTFTVYWLVGWLWRRDERKTNAARTFAALPVIVYAFFALRYIATNRFPALQVVAVFSMGMPALVSLIQIFMHEGVAEGAGSVTEVRVRAAERRLSA